MKQKQAHGYLSRRDFNKAVKLSGICYACGLCAPALFADKEKIFEMARTGPLPDLKKLTCCGYQCGDHCKYFLATRTGNGAMKREFLQKNHPDQLKDYDKNPNKYFCWGCKVKTEKMGPNVKDCKIRQCVVERKLDCCVQCKELKACDKLFPNIPSHKKLMAILQDRMIKEKGMMI